MTDLKPCAHCGGLGVHIRHPTPMEAAAGAMLEALKLAEQLYLDGIMNTPVDVCAAVVAKRRAAITLATGAPE